MIASHIFEATCDPHANTDSEDGMAGAFGQVALDQGLGAGEEDAAVQLAIDQSRREQGERRYAGESSVSYPPYGAGTQAYGASGQGKRSASIFH